MNKRFIRRFFILLVVFIIGFSTVAFADFVLPDSSSRYYEEEELSSYSADVLRLARNEIYARNGRKFTSQDLQEFFNDQPWYDGYIEPDDFSDDLLNAYEKANLLLIQKVEEKKLKNPESSAEGSRSSLSDIATAPLSTSKNTKQESQSLKQTEPAQKTTANSTSNTTKDATAKKSSSTSKETAANKSVSAAKESTANNSTVKDTNSTKKNASVNTSVKTEEKKQQDTSSNQGMSIDDCLKKYRSAGFAKKCSSLLEVFYNLESVCSEKPISLKEEKGVLQETLKDADFYCYGTVKKGYPEGICLISEGNPDSYLPAGNTFFYITNFKKGVPSGYILIWSPSGTLTFAEGCSHTKGSLLGDGQIIENGDGIELYIDNDGRPHLSFVGEYKKGSYSGKGKSYWISNEKTEGPVWFDGTWKNGHFDKGKLYYESGSLQYDGKFSASGKYHGKGTLYNKDGSVKYKGEFKNGDIKK